MAQELALIGGATNIRTASEICSAGLWKLLTEGDEGSGAVRLIAINKTLRAELEAIEPQLATWAAPVPPADLLRTLVEKAPVYGIQGKSQGEWAALFAAYLDALAPLPAEAVDDAFLRWNRGELYPKEPGRHAFYPKPAELFQLAQKTRLLLNRAAYRAKKALEYVERMPGGPISEEERARRRQEMIDRGFMTPDGKLVPLNLKGCTPPPRREDPHQMAERLRAQAPAPPPGDEEEAI